MRYIALTIIIESLSEQKREILTAVLDYLNFEGVTELEQQVIAYIPASQFNKSELVESLKNNDILQLVTIETEEVIEEKNWNEVWEKNFEPVVIDDICAIRAPFHPEFKQCEYVITIEPKMSFGTGHHATTSLIVSAMLKMDFSSKKVLDMGCGTGILGILALKLGAEEVYGIDTDSWAYENALENSSRNHVNMNIILGGEESIPKIQFDIILANINRNILLQQKQFYFNHLKVNGTLVLSGILVEDTNTIIEAFTEQGFSNTGTQAMGSWQMLEFIRL